MGQGIEPEGQGGLQSYQSGETMPMQVGTTPPSRWEKLLAEHGLAITAETPHLVAKTVFSEKFLGFTNKMSLLSLMVTVEKQSKSRESGQNPGEIVPEEILKYLASVFEGKGQLDEIGKRTHEELGSFINNASYRVVPGSDIDLMSVRRTVPLFWKMVEIDTSFALLMLSQVTSDPIPGKGTMPSNTQMALARILLEASKEGSIERKYAQKIIEQGEEAERFHRIKYHHDATHPVDPKLAASTLDLPEEETSGRKSPEEINIEIQSIANWFYKDIYVRLNPPHLGSWPVEPTEKQLAEVKTMQTQIAIGLTQRVLGLPPVYNHLKEDVTRRILDYRENTHIDTSLLAGLLTQIVTDIIRTGDHELAWKIMTRMQNKIDEQPYRGGFGPLETALTDLLREQLLYGGIKVEALIGMLPGSSESLMALPSGDTNVVESD